jgi:dienelactone hydrolase
MPSLLPAGLAAALLCWSSLCFAQEPLPGTKPLTMQGDLATQMVDGIRAYFLKETEKAAAAREARWKRDLGSELLFERSVEQNRQKLAYLIGSERALKKEPRRFDPPLPGPREYYPHNIIFEWTLTEHTLAKKLPAHFQCDVKSVRWPVYANVEGEGILLTPKKGEPIADIILLPDCDDSVEELSGLSDLSSPERYLGYRLAARGCRVLIPVLIDRSDQFSGHPTVRYTNQPHREFLWRAAYEMGRTPIGFEVDKVIAALDHLYGRKTGIIGFGEGGLIAFYAAALDKRFDAAVVSGYFGPREKLWSEPIYRDVFGLLAEFGDAEIASLIMPRKIVVEAGRHPETAGPPAPREGRRGAAPGAIVTPPLEDVRREFERVRKLIPEMAWQERPELVVPGERYARGGDPKTVDVFLSALTESARPEPRLRPSNSMTGRHTPDLLADERQRRQFTQLMEHTQRLMRESPNRRKEFWSKADASSPAKWVESTKQYRDLFWDNVLGRLPKPTAPMNARSRQVFDTPKYRGYEVVLDVYPLSAALSPPQGEGAGAQVFAYGILLVPKDIKPGGKRPVVVCQHGLEGRPQDVADPSINNPAYNQYAVKLAEQGFVTFAPQNPYIGEDRFRVALRMGQAIGQTLFGVIARQHERILDWLAEQPFVDPERMAFYGLSYGGKTAMRIPAVLERYCLSICSADYNEWIWKIADWRSSYSYLFTQEYDMPEWNLANSFNYAEMSWLICPRPFMVERGHHDGVAPDEWVGYEYARTRYRYDLLGLGDRTELEVFNGPHTIHGVGTFAFLKKHLKFGGKD